MWFGDIDIELKLHSRAMPPENGTCGRHALARAGYLARREQRRSGCGAGRATFSAGGRNRPGLAGMQILRAVLAGAVRRDQSPSKPPKRRLSLRIPPIHLS